MRREIRYVEVIYSLTHQTINSMKTHPLKYIDMIGGEKQDMWWLLAA